MIRRASPSAENDAGGPGQAVIDNWLFRDRKSAEKRFGMEIERILELRKSKEGQRELLKKMKEADPSLNGDAQKVLEQVDTNLEQLKKKESFLGKVAKLPLRAVQAVGRTIYKHPVLSALAGIAAIIALLYFTPALAPTAGQYGTKLIEGFKSVLGKLSVATPDTVVEAASQVPVTGGEVGKAVVDAATEASRSPSMMQEAGRLLSETARESGAAEMVRELTPAATEILESGTQAAGEAANTLMQPEITSELQRALRGLPSLE